MVVYLEQQTEIGSQKVLFQQKNALIAWVQMQMEFLAAYTNVQLTVIDSQFIF